jgi:hypothetical protein
LDRKTEPGLTNHRFFSGALALVAALFVFSSSTEAAVLFPKPMHLVRKVDDSISGKSMTVDEYCAGNRIVTVRGPLVTIVDYEKQELTEIDHAAGTYSITRFDEVAKARAQFGAAGKSTAASTAAPAAKWRTTPLGAKPSAGGRSLETTEIVRDGDQKETIEIGIDRQFALSRDAVEALIGSAYPNARSEHHELLLGAAGPQRGTGRVNVAAASSPDTDVYGLPSEQTITFEVEGTRITTHNAVLAVSSDTVPPEALNIDPRANRVESKITRLGKELQQLDQLAPTSKP